MRVAKDDDLLPKRKVPSTAKPSSRTSAGVSAGLRARRIARLAGVLLGGFVTLVGMMSLVGLLTDSFWVRLVVALVVVVGFPAFVSERVLKRTSLGGGLAMVTDIFAIVLLSVALVLVAADFASKPLFVREGDRYARSGSRAMARVVYFLGGVSPIFPDESGAPPAGSGAASGSASASSPPSASAK